MSPKPNCFVAFLLMALCVNVVSTRNSSILAASEQKPFNEPLNEKYTAEAWNAYQARQYRAAIANAGLCIARYEDAANRIEAALESEKSVLPTGRVSEDEKKRIGRYQILHDVALCLLVQAWSEDALGHKQQAAEAYSKVRKYPHARSARPEGELFWSPAIKASAQ